MGLENYNQLSTNEKEKFKTIVNKLFSTCYLSKATDKDYYFIVTHQDTFSEYFEMAGWTLTIDTYLDLIYLGSQLNSTRVRFSLKETILLLLLRAIFEEEIKNVARHDRIVTTVSNLIDKFSALKLKDRNIDKQSLLNALSAFKRYNIIEVVYQGDSFANMTLAINPTILAVIKVQNIKEVYDKIEQVNKKGGEDNVSTEEITVN